MSNRKEESIGRKIRSATYFTKRINSRKRMKRIGLFIFIVWFNNVAFSQVSEFKWQTYPSFSKAYTIKIKKNNSKRCIQVNKPNSNDSIWSKISVTDCDSLLDFLSNYTFKQKDNCFSLGVIKDYQNTKTLDDPDWILLNGDSVRLSNALSLFLKFDKDSNKYYYENTKMCCITDGTIYMGRFQINNQIKVYDIHSGRISEEDYRLNRIMGKLIKKYFPNQDYSRLLKEIESDKPVQKEYQ